MEILNPKHRVLVLSSPGVGHLIPHLEFAKRLASFDNLDITFFVVSADTSKSQSFLLKSSSSSHQNLHIVDLTPTNISDLVSTDQPIEVRMGIIMQESLVNLEAYITSMESPPAAMILDYFSMGAFPIADKFGVSKYLFFTTSAWIAALLLYAPTLDREIVGEFTDLTQPIPVPGCKPLQPTDTPDPMIGRETEMYRGFLQLAAGLSLADGLLVNTWVDLEPRTLNAFSENEILQQLQLKKPWVYPIGPLVREAGPVTVGNECLDWLNNQPSESVLYVSFGSGGTLSLQQMTELAMGLELSQQRFIWVVRPPTDTDSSGSFFRSRKNGSADEMDYLPAGFLSRIHGMGVVVHDWAPQEHILPHPSVGGILSHCGWNSSMESIINGVPMIAWPLFAEQKMNASILEEDTGVAIRAKSKSVVNREEIASIVRSLMVKEEGKVLRGRVKEMKKSALKAISVDGSSHDTLLEFVKEIQKTKHTKSVVNV